MAYQRPGLCWGRVAEGWRLGERRGDWGAAAAAAGRRWGGAGGGGGTGEPGLTGAGRARQNMGQTSTHRRRLRPHHRPRRPPVPLPRRVGVGGHRPAGSMAAPPSAAVAVAAVIVRSAARPPPPALQDRGPPPSTPPPPPSADCLLRAPCRPRWQPWHRRRGHAPPPPALRRRWLSHGLERDGCATPR